MGQRDVHDLVMFSSGGGYWAAAKLVAQEKGRAGLALLFADTLIEDDDNYRFLIQGAANVFGLPASLWRPLEAAWLSLPGIDQMPERRSHLQALATAAMAAVPGLVWLQEGRDPWQVFEDERLIGNTRADPCSKHLKRELAANWREAHLKRGEVTVHVGIGWHERHRFEGRPGDKPGLRERMAAKGWRYEAPLIQPPHLSRQEIFDWMHSEGLAPPRLYALGFEHANCGGFCVKAGHDHFRLLLEQRPELYAYHERQEERVRRLLGNDVAILRDRAGGRATPLTMAAFRERVQAGQGCPMFDTKGCGCFIDEEEAPG